MAVSPTPAWEKMRLVGRIACQPLARGVMPFRPPSRRRHACLYSLAPLCPAPRLTTRRHRHVLYVHRMLRRHLPQHLRRLRQYRPRRPARANK